MKPIELSFEELYKIQQAESSAEQHTVIADQRRSAFLTMEDFNKKWNINQTPPITVNEI